MALYWQYELRNGGRCGHNDDDDDDDDDDGDNTTTTNQPLIIDGLIDRPTDLLARPPAVCQGGGLRSTVEAWVAEHEWGIGDTTRFFVARRWSGWSDEWRHRILGGPVMIETSRCAQVDTFNWGQGHKRGWWNEMRLRSLMVKGCKCVKVKVWAKWE